MRGPTFLPARKRLARRRTHYHYTHKGVVLAQDSACVGVAYDGKVWVEAQKDPATSLGEAFGDGAPVPTDRVIEHLEELKEYGLLPLIFQTDNNKAYCSDRAEQWLQAEQVIHLISRPHTPQDNAAIERLIGEMKSDRIFPLNANTSHFTRAGGVSTAAEIVELLNSAIEWTIDYISTEQHPMAKRAKDMASAAVFLSYLNCAVVWGLIIFSNWHRIEKLEFLRWPPHFLP